MNWSSPVTELADALERADWSGVSIGNKVMLKGAIDALRGVAQAPAWQSIETAPKDGTKVDLLFAYPRGRQNDCQWRQGDVYGDGGWYWSIPQWGYQPGLGIDWHLLPEDEWETGSYPNMEPTHWMLPPALPTSVTSTGQREPMAWCHKCSDWHYPADECSVTSTLHSPPEFLAPHNSGEMLPKREPAGSGGETSSVTSKVRACSFPECECGDGFHVCPERCTCGGDADQPTSHHDISCPMSLQERGQS